jgi:pimeloyl-ACP methyl ester carboxylesterase
MSDMPRTVVRWFVLSVAVLALVATGVWQVTRTHFQNIEVDGHKISYARHGSGSPAVVFVAGGYAAGESKLPNFKSLFTRFDTTSFYYDRPGMGASEADHEGRPPLRVVEEMHMLLERVGIPPPYILVGRSLGGLYSRAFAIKYPHDVAGLVLSDGSDERQVVETRRLNLQNYPEPPPSESNLQKPEFLGMTRIWNSGQLDVVGKLPDVPMVVITSLNHGSEKNPVPPEVETLWRKLQDDVFQSTTHGMHIVTKKSGHAIAATEPDLEVNAIKWVLETARTAKKSTKK